MFDTKQNKAILEKFINKIESHKPDTTFERDRDTLIIRILSSMLTGPDDWTKNCQITIDELGDRFFDEYLSIPAELTKSRLDDVCSICFRFMFEYYLSIKSEFSIEFLQSYNFVFSNIDSFEEKARRHIHYILYQLPITIFKQIVNSSEIEHIKNFNSFAVEAKSQHEVWRTELSKSEERVNALKDNLDKYETAYNFVGLYQGFDELSTEKEAEKGNILFWLKVFGVIIVTPIISELVLIYSNINNLSSIREGFLYSVLPAISLVAISIYYFRVLLFNYKSVKSQLLQIDLRKTLCRFIQNYAEYSKDLKSNDIESLEKFENIIFSGIVSGDDKLPSTYDGLDQFTKFIKSIKS